MSKRSRKAEVIPFQPWIERNMNSFKHFTDEEKENALRQLISHCDYETRVKIAKISANYTHLDVLTNLPAEAFEHIVQYLSVLDALLACHTSLIWNERISALNSAWKRKYTQLGLFGNPTEFQPQGNWKAECERAVALTMKITNLTMVKHSTRRVHIHLEPIMAMDFCDDVMVCCGYPDVNYRHSPGNVVQIYQKKLQTWDILGSYDLPSGYHAEATCCSLVKGFQLVVGDTDGILTFWNIKLPINNTGGLAVSVRKVHAHTMDIVSVCADKDIGIAASAGKNERIHLWDLNSGVRLKSFVYSKSICHEVTMCFLSGEKSPFVGYDCFLFQRPNKNGTVAMACWGGGIPLSQALFAADVCHTSDYNIPGFKRNLTPNVFVQGGSIVYGFQPSDNEGHSSGFKERLIWQPIDPDDFVNADINISEEQIQIFRESLHPWRENRSVNLPRDTEEILGVGRCFSIVVCADDPTLWIIKNSTGDMDKLLIAEQNFSLFGKMHKKLITTKWLDGFEHIEPDAVILMKQRGFSKLMYWIWRRDALIFQCPSQADLQSVMKKERSLLASSVTRPRSDKFQDDVYFD